MEKKDIKIAHNRNDEINEDSLLGNWVWSRDVLNCTRNNLIDVGETTNHKKLRIRPPPSYGKSQTTSSCMLASHSDALDRFQNRDRYLGEE